MTNFSSDNKIKNSLEHFINQDIEIREIIQQLDKDFQEFCDSENIQFTGIAEPYSIITPRIKRKIKKRKSYESKHSRIASQKSSNRV